MNNVCVIGAGQLGSRHLQALKAVRAPLNITVVDPFSGSLKTAEERFGEAPGFEIHEIRYMQDIAELGETFDLAIVATNSEARREVVEKLLEKSTVSNMILEKLLFQKKEDYEVIGDLLKKNNCRTWVNCSMRAMTFYAELSKKIKSGPLTYLVSGSRFGMITNAIHYIDHIAYLTGCDDFEVIKGALDPNPIESKRPGFLELNGTLTLQFKDGSQGTFTCFPEGDAPFLVEIHSGDYRCIVRENEKKAWESSKETDWKWREIIPDIPFQSQMTTRLAESILQSGRCPLVTYESAAKMHVTLLEGLLEWMNANGKKKFDRYPFT